MRDRLRVGDCVRCMGDAKEVPGRVIQVIEAAYAWDLAHYVVRWEGFGGNWHYNRRDLVLIPSTREDIATALAG